jgi:hypothetical protein
MIRPQGQMEKEVLMCFLDPLTREAQGILDQARCGIAIGLTVEKEEVVCQRYQQITPSVRQKLMRTVLMRPRQL